ncbi:MAG: ABC transporter ATP-binding protein [Dehalococcoidales bacterium]
MALLDVQDLKTYFHTEYGLVKAVDGISWHVNRGEILGLVGESGCGKSVSILSVMQLIPTPPGEIVSGKVMFDGVDLLEYEANGPQMRAIRGSKITMIFQEPMTSLNPVLTISRQLTESLELHLDMDKGAAVERAIELLKMVGVPDAARRLDDYPHMFSGGMRQRVMIAMAISCNPMIIFADEPTTAVDVTTQAQLLELMKDLVTRLDTSLVIVTHNLGVVARYAQRIYVMYSGRIIESGLSDDIFEHPQHPYTIGLLHSVPKLGERHGVRKLVPIEGLPPNLINMPPTCAFLPRCTHKVKQCTVDPWPPLREVGKEHYISCYVDVKGK